MRLLVASVVACHAAATIPPWPVAHAGAYRPTDPFHAAVVEPRAGWGNPMAFWPCALDGATFLCGTAHVLAIRGERIEVDAALERGLAPGIVEAIVGRWPDEAWLVARTEMGPEVSCGLCHFVAYRWRSDRWERAGELADIFPFRWIAAWHDALFVESTDRPRHILAIGDSPLAKRVVTDSRCAGAADFAASPLVVLGSTCGGKLTDVTRWTDAGPVVDHPLEESGDLAVVATARGPAIIGSTFSDAAVALRLDGDKWVSRDPPGKKVGSYAVAPDGTEWIVTDTGLFAREPGKAWQPVDGWRAEALRYGRTSTAWIARISIAEGSVWLEVIVEGACEGTKGCEYRSLILRTGKPASPITIARDRGV